MEEDAIFVNYSFSVSVCRLIDMELWPTNIQVKAEINVIDEDLIEVALRKINYWLEEFLRGAVIVPANDLGLSLILDDDNSPRIHNTIVLTPEMPTDDHLCFLLQSKLQALAGSAFSIPSMEFTSDNSDGFTVTYVGDGRNRLPDMEDWITGPTWFTEPWWDRADTSTFDTQAGPDADLSVIPAWARDLSFLEYDNPQQEAVILMGDFKPRIIENPDER